MEKIESKVKIDKELLDKVKTYNINIEAFMDTGFRRYVDYIVYKNKLEKHKKDLDTDFLSKGFGKSELRELKGHLDTEKDTEYITNTDIDIIASGISHSLHERMDMILDIIRRLCDETADGSASRSDIISEAEIQGIVSDRIEGALDRLSRNGQIYEAIHGKYRVSK